jgi:proteasome accessory factor B
VVAVRFDKGVASWIVGGHWHPTQQIEKQADGSLIFRVTVSGYEEMLYWVLSFGAQAEVLEPAPLRAAVAEAADRMMARYCRKEALPRLEEAEGAVE